MEKINFTNGQEPAINGTNLNKIQTNFENAINETNKNIETNTTNIGELEELNTIDKTNLVRAINETNAKGYCQAYVLGEVTCGLAGSIISALDKHHEANGFYFDEVNKRIVIPAGTKIVQTGGMLCGCGSLNSIIYIKDADGNYPATFNPQQTGILNTHGTYQKNSLPTCIVELDETKEHYVTLFVSGYSNSEFILNTGFGSSSYIYVREL